MAHSAPIILPMACNIIGAEWAIGMNLGEQQQTRKHHGHSSRREVLETTEEKTVRRTNFLNVKKT